MADANSIFIGKGGSGDERLILRRANRHGLIAGSTGTGKTVTLQGIAEDFSRNGVPVFVADVKGDLSGLAMAGSPQGKLHEAFSQRAQEVGETDWSYDAAPAIFWDLFGEQGHPIRATVTEMGPLLISRLLGLNEVQEGVLTIAFHVADKDGLLLLDLDDLQAMLADCAARADDLTTVYGNVSKATVGTIQRALLQLRSQGGEHFFGEPALDIADLMRVDENGRGYVSILAADKLMASPQLYATFLLWLLSELFEVLPEVGDPDKPKLVFFFDEAHLLFTDAPKALLDKVEQVVRLIRSKGVGVYFITQNPIDIPDDVAGQLGNRIQHGLRAFTPRDQAAVKAAADTFRANPDVDVATAIIELKTGEALVSLLQDDGAPAPVDRTLIKPPRSRVGPVTADERKLLIETSPVAGHYEAAVDRESAEEILAAKGNAAAQAAAAANAQAEAEKTQAAEAKAAAQQARLDAQAAVAKARADAAAARVAAQPSMTDKMLQSAGRAMASSVGRQIATTIGRQLLRGLLGGLSRN
jgi:DNA helicase HerA-like ATPase